ncbi:hypothetical protein C8J56DRAFT_1063406 [Mycena floridula]|nr:hypothetical protein C8J56DRAFT_1063406 [Mycena floridula]
MDIPGISGIPNITWGMRAPVKVHPIWVNSQRQTKCPLLSRSPNMAPTRHGLIPDLVVDPDNRALWILLRNGQNLDVKKWCCEANGDTIFYKLIEHLEAYYSVWKTFTNAKHFRIATADDRHDTDMLVRSSSRQLKAPAYVPEQFTIDPEPRTGMLPATKLNSLAPPSWDQKRKKSTQGPDSSVTSSSVVVSSSNIIAENNDTTTNAERPQKRARHGCAKCGRAEGYKGNSGSWKCKHPCRDCEKKSCLIGPDPEPEPEIV